MTRKEFADARLGDLVVRKGRILHVDDIERSTMRINAGGHWISYRNVEAIAKPQAVPASPRPAEPAPVPDFAPIPRKIKDGCLHLPVALLVKYGFPTTAILYAVKLGGREGFCGSTKELHELLPFLPPEYIRSLVPKMEREGLLHRVHVRRGQYQLTLTDNV
jgi:hypothetical protein